jgi:hypothetical protein
LEVRESYLTLPSEQFITIEMALTPAEQRLIWRLRQLAKEQCRGTMIVFEAGGFGLFKLNKQERIGR